MLVLSMAVPTCNERENTGLLIQRPQAALSDLAAEAAVLHNQGPE
jgi:hypothetical protein